MSNELPTNTTKAPLVSISSICAHQSKAPHDTANFTFTCSLFSNKNYADGHPASFIRHVVLLRSIPRSTHGLRLRLLVLDIHRFIFRQSPKSVVCVTAFSFTRASFFTLNKLDCSIFEAHRCKQIEISLGDANHRYRQADYTNRGLTGYKFW